MKTEIKSGGAAFPRPAFVGGGAATAGQVGMTLRDYFAAQAMQGLIGETPEMMREIAVSAYQQADAMLAAREVAP